MVYSPRRGARAWNLMEGKENLDFVAALPASRAREMHITGDRMREGAGSRKCHGSSSH